MKLSDLFEEDWKYNDERVIADTPYSYKGWEVEKHMTSGGAYNPRLPMDVQGNLSSVYWRVIGHHDKFDRRVQPLPVELLEPQELAEIEKLVANKQAEFEKRMDPKHADHPEWEDFPPSDLDELL